MPSVVLVSKSGTEFTVGSAHAFIDAVYGRGALPKVGSIEDNLEVFAGGSEPQENVHEPVTLADLQSPTSPAGSALRGAYVPFWAASETVTAGTVRMAPDGDTIVRTADGTTGATYDATEQAAWTVASSGGGSFDTASAYDITGQWRFSLMPKIRNFGNPDAQIIGKPSGEGSTGVWNIVHDDSRGYLIHFTTGPNTTGGGPIGVGVDNGGTGITVANKATGKGIYIHNQNTISAANANGLFGLQQSSVASLFYLQQDAPPAGQVSKPVLELVTANHTPPAGQKLLSVNLSHAGGEQGYIEADTGVLLWRWGITVRPRTAAGEAFRFIDNRGTSGDDIIRLMAPSELVKDVGGATDTAEQGAAIKFHARAGSAAVYYPFEWRVSKKRQSIMLRGHNGAVALGSEVWQTLIEAKNHNALGFFGAEPVTRRAATADATDLATVITLANALKADLVALGLKAA